jgi:hypothetical protein
MRALNIGTIHSKTTDATGTRFRFVLDNYEGTPTLSLYRYTRGNSPSGLVAPWAKTSHTVRLPHMTFAFACRHRRWGMLKVWRIISRFYLWLAKGC